MDIRHIVRHWIRKPESNNGIRVSCPDCDMDPAAVPVATRGDLRPFVVVKLGPPRKRTKRSVDNDCYQGSTKCCREHLYVQFSEIGWDKWIISPDGYHAFYCKGSCEGIVPYLYREFCINN